MESSVDGVVMVDASGTIVVWNEAQARITGVTAAEALGQPLWDVQYSLSRPTLQVPGLLERLCASTKSLLAGGSLADGSAPMSEEEIQQPDGRRVVVQTTAFPVRSEDGYLLGSVCRDVTEQRRVQEALRRSEQRYRFLAQNVRDVIWTMGLDGRLTYVSPSVEQLRGYTVEQALRQTIEEALTPDRRAWFAALCRRRRTPLAACPRAGNWSTCAGMARPSGLRPTSPYCGTDRGGRSASSASAATSASGARQPRR